MNSNCYNQSFQENQDEDSCQADLPFLTKHLFQDAAAQLMTLYKESIRRSEESYSQGKEDAYEEVLKWFLSYSSGSGGNFKHVSVNEFFQFIS
jgi:hypothetical protein